MNKRGNYISNATQIAKYICNEYYNFTEKKKEISPIKLQKSLYFCFAYWGAFVRKSSIGKEYVEEEINLSEYLFPEEFHAWVYGPVIPEIFRLFRDNKLDYKEFDATLIFNKDNEIVKDTIDSLLKEIFETSDFKLVSVSHEDNCWKKNFDINSPSHNKVIDPSDIIEEYTLRESL